MRMFTRPFQEKDLEVLTFTASTKNKIAGDRQVGLFHSLTATEHFQNYSFPQSKLCIFQLESPAMSVTPLTTV